jgi:hypothetical protein
MSFKDTGKKAPGLVISRNPTWLSANDGLLVAGVSGKSIAICDVLISSGSGKKLGTGTNGTGTLIAHVSSGSSSVKRPIRVPEGESVYTDASAYITVTYYETDEMSGDIINPTGEGLHDWQGEECPLGNLLTFKTADGFTDWQANKFYKIIYPNGSFDCVEGSTITALGTYASANSYTHGLWDVFNSCDSCESSTPAVTTTPSPTLTLCLSGATNSGAYNASVVNGQYDWQQNNNEGGKVQYWKSDTSAKIQWITATDQWVASWNDGGVWKWAYSTSEDVTYPYNVTTWTPETGGGSGWGGTLSAASGDCPAATTTTTVAATTTTAAAMSNLCISGSFYSEIDTTWVPVADLNGYPQWHNQGAAATDMYLFWESNVWYITDDQRDSSMSWYMSDDDATRPWSADWTMAGITVTEGDC